MPPWLTVLLIAVAAVILFLAILSYRLFRMACIARNDFNAEAFFAEVEKKAGPEMAASVKEAFLANQADPGEAVYIQSDDGLRLKGYYMPASPETGRVLIMCHGWNSSPGHDFAMAFPFFKSLGWSILAIEQRAQNSSEGKYMTFGAWEHRDVCRWIDWLAARPDVTHIAMDGISMGASTVMLTLGETLPDKVKGAIADSGYDSVANEIRHLGRRLHLPTGPMLPLMDLWTRALARFSIYDTDTKKAVAKTCLPLLLVHGTGDTFVPHECTLRNAEAYTGTRNMVLVEGAPHGFSYVMETARCQETLRDFLQSICE